MIKLWDGYVIDTDEYQFILAKPVEYEHKDRGTVTNNTHTTYHGTLAQACTAFARMKHREACQAEGMTLAQAIQTLQEIEGRVRAMLEGIPEKDTKRH